MAISGDVFRINQVYELLQEGQWPNEYSLPPAPFLTYGWFGGGVPGPRSTVDRIDFADDTATASVRGPLSLARFYLAGTGNLEYGWFGGGQIPTTIFSRVDRITFSTDTATATSRGPLSLARDQLSATGNLDYGWFGGGTIPSPATRYSRVDRITFVADSSTASVRGPLSLARQSLASTGNLDYGWFSGGFVGPTLNTTIVDRINFSDDTATASVRGPLSLARQVTGSTSDLSFGWFGAGFAGPSISNTSRVDRINFSTDTETASIRGPLSSIGSQLAATGDSNYGWFGGKGSLIDRITYSSDAVVASVRGSLGVEREGFAAVL